MLLQDSGFCAPSRPAETEGAGGWGTKRAPPHRARSVMASPGSHAPGWGWQPRPAPPLCLHGTRNIVNVLCGHNKPPWFTHPAKDMRHADTPREVVRPGQTYHPVTAAWRRRGAPVSEATLGAARPLVLPIMHATLPHQADTNQRIELAVHMPHAAIQWRSSAKTSPLQQQALVHTLEERP